jgi:ABC-2 type transport system ATP-binding protein
VLVMNGGRLAFDGTVAELRQRAGVPTPLTAEFASPPSGGPPWPVVAREARHLTVQFDRAQVGAGAVLASLGELGEVVDARLHEPDLERIVRRL